MPAAGISQLYFPGTCQQHQGNSADHALLVPCRYHVRLPLLYPAWWLCCSREQLLTAAWCHMYTPAISVLGSTDATSCPHTGHPKCLILLMHAWQNVWLQLAVWASNNSPLQTGQWRLLSLGPLAEPNPRGHTAAGCRYKSQCSLAIRQECCMEIHN